ncbi:MAG: hypothetical protein FJ206_17315 [Gemmatimonadetes bacterium]|nr:hypothetical protein [Gemmatimonadota bacterium]
MRVLLDENLPADLVADLVEVDATTVGKAGWGGITNGELLRRMAGQFNALLTMDRNLQHQQQIAQLPFGVVLVRAPSHRLVHLRPLIPAILAALSALQPGELRGREQPGT